jgi:hypothetical protein
VVTMGDDACISDVYRKVTRSDCTCAPADDARTRRPKCGLRHPSSPAPRPRLPEAGKDSDTIIAEKLYALLAVIGKEQRPLWRNYFRLMAWEARRT